MIAKKTRQKQQEDNSEGDICYLENICGAGQTQTYTIEDQLNIDAGNKGYNRNRVLNLD